MVTSKFLNPKNDVAFRKIFGSENHKGILIHFINDVLGLEGRDMIEKVSFLSTIQDPEIAYKKERKYSRCTVHRSIWSTDHSRNASFTARRI